MIVSIVVKSLIMVRMNALCQTNVRLAASRFVSLVDRLVMKGR